MKPHPRIRKTVKWGGAVVTVLLVVVWIGSGWWMALWVTGTGSTWYLTGGALRYAYEISAPTGAVPEMFIEPVYHSFIWRPGWANIGAGSVVLIDLPLWLPAAFGIGVTTFAWYLDSLARRRERAARLNLCPKCNYDRTGLPAGAVCPECGKARVTP